ncbi:MAG: hypothetical protein GF383_02240 [Candidatus Lokiarchaeota archaeon]|nr:hypothetical protein [Candidatus Lokiarchaeota archaeon]MBD3338234.1 hypothetical protein [Candidatus Lokiarchaeota archaeon]
MYIHINSHFAIGVIIASLFNPLFNFDLLEFLLIVFASFLNDFDVFFSKYAKDHNHRNLITHSIIPSIVLIILGIVFYWPALFISGFAYFIHIVVDTFDWGTNFFYFPQRTFGLRLLIKNEEENLSEHLSQYNNPESFFDFKYYNNKISLAVEVILFVVMIITIIFFALEFMFIIFFYFLGLYFHLARHFRLKKIEKEKENQE